MLPRPQPVGIHRQTHGTPRLAPLEPGVEKHPIQAFPFGLAFDQSGTRDHHGLFEVGCHRAPANHVSGCSQVFYT